MLLTDIVYDVHSIVNQSLHISQNNDKLSIFALFTCVVILFVVLPVFK